MSETPCIANEIEAIVSLGNAGVLADGIVAVVEDRRK